MTANRRRSRLVVYSASAFAIRALPGVGLLAYQRYSRDSMASGFHR
jgi:hypothetical protein